MISYENALKAAKSGDAVFIIGAGFSIGAKNDQQNKLPTGDQFRDKLANEIDMSTTHTLDVVAQDYIDQKDELSLLNILKQEFIVSSFEENYNGLISLKKAHFILPIMMI